MLGCSWQIILRLFEKEVTMKRGLVWAIGIFMFAIVPVTAEEPTTKFDLKNFDYCQICDQITFSGDEDRPVDWSKLKIRHESTDDISIVLDNNQKQISVLGFEDAEYENKNGLCPKVSLLVPDEESKALWQERFKRFKEKRENYLASKDRTQKKTIKEFPLTSIDCHVMYGTVQFGVIECSGGKNNGQGFMDYEASISVTKARLRDDGIDYTSVQIIHHDTSSNWVANFEAIILVPNKEDEYVWSKALEEWNVESRNFHRNPTIFDRHRVLPDERLSILKNKISDVDYHSNDHYNEGEKYSVSRIVSSEFLSGLVEFKVFDWRETYYVPIENIEVKPVAETDLPKNWSPDELRGELFVEFSGKSKLFPKGFHYKTAVIYAKPEVLEDWKKKIELYKEAYRKYSSKE